MCWCPLGAAGTRVRPAWRRAGTGIVVMPCEASALRLACTHRHLLQWLTLEVPLAALAFPENEIRFALGDVVEESHRGGAGLTIHRLTSAGGVQDRKNVVSSGIGSREISEPLGRQKARTITLRNPPSPMPLSLGWEDSRMRSYSRLRTEEGPQWTKSQLATSAAR